MGVDLLVRMLQYFPTYIKYNLASSLVLVVHGLFLLYNGCLAFFYHTPTQVDTILIASFSIGYIVVSGYVPTYAVYIQPFRSIVFAPISRNELYLGLCLLRSFDVFLATTVLHLIANQLSIGDFRSLLVLVLFVPLLIQTKVLFDILIARLNFLWTAGVFAATLISFSGSLVTFLYLGWPDTNTYLCILALALVNLLVWQLSSQHVELKNILTLIKD